MYSVGVIAILILGIVIGVYATNYQKNKTLDRAFEQGAKTVDSIKEGKSEEIYKNALSDYTETNTQDSFTQAVAPFTNSALKNGEATLYSDNSGGYVFIQEYTNDKSEFQGQLTVSILTNDDGTLVVSNIVPSLN